MSLILKEHFIIEEHCIVVYSNLNKTDMIQQIFIFLVIIVMQAQSISLKQSPNDKRQYEAIILSNKLKVIFIHDDEIAKSACSISVGVGSMFDKDRSLGLAHFLQHMLFMGSKKFQGHNEYSSFISTNSGYDNAYTSDTETNYYFEIKNDAFYEAVERLTNFFTGALLKEECIEKESQAVHQQFVLWSNDDNCRKWQVLRKLASPPYSRFTIGNTQTLRHQHIRQDLVQFYQKYYSANIINAVLCSNYSIQEMKQKLIPFLEAIPNKQVKFPQLDLHFKNQQTGKLVFMQSIKDESIMEYFWAIEYLKPHYKKHLSDYITHVAGHEGKNSLLSILKSKKYASELSAYSQDLKTQTLIGMQIKLTDLGQQEYEKVYNIVMDFMSSLKPEETVYEEIRQRKLIDFQFKEKQKVADYVCRLSSKLHWVPINEILHFQSIFQQFSQPSISRVLGQLNPFNVIIVFSSNSQLEDPIQEIYLGAKYTIQDLPARQKSGQKFAPLPPNKFIPINTSMCTQPESVSQFPIKLSDNIYFLFNSSFRVCKGGIQLRVYSEESTVFLEFYASYLKLLLKEYTYPAETLSCKVQFDSDDCLFISVFGFTDTVIKVIQTISTELHATHTTQQSQALFDVALQNLIEEYENFYNQESDSVADQTLDIILTKGYETIPQILSELGSYEFKEINKKISNLWKKNTFKWTIVGNFDQTLIKNLIQKSEHKMRKQSQKSFIPEQCSLKVKQNIVHQIHLQSQELSSSCSIVYFQAGPYTEQLYYKLLLLKNHIDEPFFNELRTQKQMAYYLAAKVQNTRSILGLRFILVSSTRDPKNISDEIKTFVFNFFSKLDEDLSGTNEDKLIKIKQSVLTKVKAPHPNLEALFDFVVKQIEDKTFYFNRKQESEIKKYLEPIKVDDLKETWNHMKNRTLQIYVVSKAHEEKYKQYGIQSSQIEKIRDECGYWSHNLTTLASE